MEFHTEIHFYLPNELSLDLFSDAPERFLAQNGIERREEKRQRMKRGRGFPKIPWICRPLSVHLPAYATRTAVVSCESPRGAATLIAPLIGIKTSSAARCQIDRTTFCGDCHLRPSWVRVGGARRKPVFQLPESNRCTDGQDRRSIAFRW